MKDPYRYFRVEARELLDALQHAVLDLGTDETAAATLLRASHTLKGAAGVVGHEAVARLAHELEDRVADRAEAPKLLAIVDAIAAELATLDRPAETRGGPEIPIVRAESVRLDLAEVDTLLASIADVGARISSLRAKAASRGDAELHASLETVERRAHDTLEDARRLRLLPAETLFAEIERAAHDAATSEGRAVAVETAGGEIRLDAHVLALVRDALLQLVRNAIAHAIEPAGERAALGKPAAGRIAIRFDVRGPRVVVTCHDDGRGLDLEAMREVIVANGLAPDASGLDATALFAIAMRSGVTTRATPTQLAGRGIGLQVLGATVERLRGTVAVQTRAGRGTAITLDVPVSMTAAPALVVASGELVVTFPLDAVVRTARLAANDVTSTPSGDTFTDEGETIRFAPLDHLLPPSRSVESWTAVILDAGGARAAVGVERVIGIASEVILPLPPSCVADALVVGASLDGEGNPRLALVPRLLVEAVLRARRRPEAPAAPRSQKRILVIDDSLTSRMLEQSILEAAGYAVTIAASGEEALVLARGARFDLFVVDVDMPGMDGFEVVARTRADPELAGIPAVLVTSRAAPEDRRRGQDVGARAYIVKGDFAQDQFLDTVRRLAG